MFLYVTFYKLSTGTLRYHIGKGYIYFLPQLTQEKLITLGACAIKFRQISTLKCNYFDFMWTNRAIMKILEFSCEWLRPLNLTYNVHV